MKNKIEINVYVLAGVIIALVLGAGIFFLFHPGPKPNTATDYTNPAAWDNLSTTTQSKTTQPPITQANAEQSSAAQPSKAQQFQFQIDCTAQAQKVVDSMNVGVNLNSQSGQYNYYNPNYNECFVLIYSTVGQVPVTSPITGESYTIPSTYADLQDAYTGEDLAYCMLLYEKVDGSGYTTELPNGCFIGNGPGIPYAQWKAYVNDRMGGTATVPLE